MEALKGKLSETQADKIRISLDNFFNLNEKIAKIEALIDEKSKPYQHIVDLLCTVPGIKEEGIIVRFEELTNYFFNFVS